MNLLKKKKKRSQVIDCEKVKNENNIKKSELK